MQKGLLTSSSSSSSYYSKRVFFGFLWFSSPPPSFNQVTLILLLFNVLITSISIPKYTLAFSTPQSSLSNNHNNNNHNKHHMDNNNNNNNMNNNNDFKMIGAINIALTVDGFIAGKNGNIDWLNDQPQVEGGEDFGFGNFMKNINAMVMGRNTFDIVTKFGKEMWAYGDDRLPIIVWTRNVHSVTIPDWIAQDETKNVQVMSFSSVYELWDYLKNELKKNNKQQDDDNDDDDNDKTFTIYVDGGKTIQSFLKAGLIHRLHLTRIPILLGEGIPLFPLVDESDDDGGDTKTANTNNNGGIKQQNLKHISTKSYSNGFVVSVYDVVVNDIDNNNNHNNNNTE